MADIENENPDLSKIIEEIYKKSLKSFGLNAEDPKLQIILISYRESSDSLFFWYLYPSNTERSIILSRMNIRNGEGTVGFILRSKKLEFVNNTFDDPRGSVGFVDSFISNMSWLGIPVLHDKNKESDVRLIISFSYADKDFWTDARKNVFPRIKRIVNLRSKELKLLNQIKLKDDLLNIFLQQEPDKNELLTKILEVTDATVSYSYVLIKQDNQIKQLKINESIIENRIITFLNWCALFKNKCMDCPITNVSIINKNCKYNADFLSFLGDYDFVDLPLNDKKDFVVKLYYSQVNKTAITIDKNILIEPFKEVIEIFSHKHNPPIKKKIFSELIHSIVNHLSKALINGSEFKIDEKTFKKWSEIIKKNTTNSIELNIDYLNKLQEKINLLKTELKNRLLFIELWQNNINGIEIITFFHEKNKKDVLV